jgi:hypothetical protein
VFHGTTVRFSEFSKSEDGGFHFGDRAAAGWRLADLTGDEATRGNRILAAYLSIQRPKRLGFDAGDAQAWREQIERAKAAGFDGIRYPNSEEVDEDEETGEHPATYSWIVFEPEQIHIVVNKPAGDMNEGDIPSESANLARFGRTQPT